MSRGPLSRLDPGERFAGSRRSLLLHSIFTSFQGEGPFLGSYQLFLRLRGCNLACRYCDTPEAREEAGGFRVELEGATAECGTNPVPIEVVEGWVSRLWERGMHSMALTGGEPLLQVDSLVALLSRIVKHGIPVYLETNGTLPGALAELLDLVEYISMDVKLPSALGGRDLLPLQVNFLQVAQKKDVFLKVVLEESTPPEELERACRFLGREAPEVPLVIQPASPSCESKPPSFSQLLEAHRTASKFFQQVRVIPQVHRLAGWV